MSWGNEIVIGIVLSVAVFTDLRTGKIYNAITFPVLIFGLIYQFIYGGTSAGLAALSAVGIAFLLFFPLYVVRVFGAGDVKLLMAVAAWSHSGFVIRMGGFAIVIGAVVGTLILLQKKGFRGALLSVRSAFSQSKTKKNLRMPFAPAFFCAFLWLKISEEYQWFLV